VLYPGTDLLSPYDYHRPQGLNFRVRDGIGCGPLGKGTGNSQPDAGSCRERLRPRHGTGKRHYEVVKRSPARTMRPVRSGQSACCVKRCEAQVSDIASESCLLDVDYLGLFGHEDNCGQANRLISTGQLKGFHPLHLQPINVVVCHGSDRESLSCEGLRAYMLSALILSEHSYPALGLAAQQEHQRFVQPNPLVLELNSLKTPPPTVGRDQPGSRRSEPSSRTALIGEQPNPWDLLQPQDAMSRHRGAKPYRR
jgi:hypothetical protein